MPNWCRNRVTVYGNEEEVSKVVDIFESKDTVFGKIIPSPDWKNIPNEDGELPEVVEHKNPKTGEVSFVTKWDVTGSVEVEEQDSEIVEINFATAWSPPEAICSKLREMFPDLSFSWFYDEPGMEFAGYL